MQSYAPGAVFNCDQTGLKKELHSDRSLADQGCRIVTRTVQSTTAITHSVTLMPQIYANGTVDKKLFVVVGEPSGQFPPTKPLPNLPNLVVRAHYSHIMNRPLTEEWLRECIFHPNCPSDMLMIVDSWTSFRNHAAIQALVPPGKKLKILNLPPHTTGRYQPLDIYYNGPLKKLVSSDRLL